MIETLEDIRLEKKGIDAFVNVFGGTYQKLAPDDVDYRVLDNSGKAIAYVEVVRRNRTIRDSYPLPVLARKLVKLHDKRLNPVIVWVCEDGIIYSRTNNIFGHILKEEDWVIYFDKQKSFKYIKFI